MKNIILCCLLFFISNALSANVIPVGNENNTLYYKIGGANDFALPPVSDTDTITLDTNTNLGLGYSCNSFNPALSIVSSMNDFKDKAQDIESDVLTNVKAAVITLPMYELAKLNPTVYALINNKMISAQKKLEISTKSCEMSRQQISKGENPYQDWGSIAINDQWKKELSLTAEGNTDINQVKKDIDATGGDYGVAWTNGNKDNEGVVRAGGKEQPPVHVIADTIKAGYNAMLNRNLQSDADAPTTGASAELARVFQNPANAMKWTTNVVGDQTITTCNDNDCKRNQGSIVGHGLLTGITSCNQDKNNCVETIRVQIGKLVTGNLELTKENLEKVSAGGIMVSPEAIAAIRNMDSTQQSIIVNKLAQEVAMQRVIDKALMAKNILATGAQVPVIAANHPAQLVIGRAITNIDNDIRSLTFETQIRKQMMSDTISQVLSYSHQQQQNALHVEPISAAPTIMENSAITKQGGK
jgi:integrating conjugative element protein (TIGR03755 family)